MPLIHHDFDYWDGQTGQTVTVTLYSASHSVVSPSPYTLSETGTTGRYTGAAGSGLAAGTYRMAVAANGVVVWRGSFKWDGATERDATAGAVWDERVDAHSISGSMGEAMGGVTPSSVADAVWNEATSAHLTAGTFGEMLAIIQGLCGLHMRVVSTTYTGSPGRPTGSVLKIYGSKANADADSSPLAVVNVTRVFDSLGRPTTVLSND